MTANEWHTSSAEATLAAHRTAKAPGPTKPSGAAVLDHTLQEGLPGKGDAGLALRGTAFVLALDSDLNPPDF